LHVYAPRPNPFIERTTISFLLPESGEVEIGIYNVMGRRLRLLETGWIVEGSHELEWDGRDDDGQKVASGAYVARIRTGDEELTRTLLLIR
jgi:flagellar hook assembly protein FlgD